MFDLNIDIETYSATDIEEGLAKYIADPDFEITLIAYSLDGGPEEIIDMASGEEPPEWFVDALTDPDYDKKAFNAAFETRCLNEYWDIDITQWYCTMVKAAMCGYPMSLDTVGKAMNLPVQKDRNGKALIKLFGCPDKMGNRVYPWMFPSKWAEFKEYCKTDVKVEKQIDQNLSWLKISDFERKSWFLDQKINNVGVMLDVQLAEQAVILNDLNVERLEFEAKELTGLSNPNSPKQLKEWLSEQLKEPVTQLTKESIQELLERDNLWGIVRRVLEIRQEMSKTSISKYVAMMKSVGADKRIRGLLQFYGAAKTGRWAGRIVQMQNLTHTKVKGKDLSLEDAIKELTIARKALKTGDLDLFTMLYDNVSNTLSRLIRTAFIPSPGNEFTVSDFSAIEAKITAWFANEGWRMKIFKQGGVDIYKASASQMFNIPYEEITKSDRSKGKVAELALGYQGAKNAMIKMGALKMGLKEEELQPIVNAWRKANPNIVKLWYAVEGAAIEAIANPGKVVRIPFLAFQVRHKTLFIQLPSGRLLSYVDPVLVPNKYNPDNSSIRYMGVDQKTKQWCKQDTYGGKLVENIVQGTARDVLADSLLRLDEAGFMIITHVHDEGVMETEIAHNRLEEATEIMSQEISWAPGLPLSVQSFNSPFYLKD